MNKQENEIQAAIGTLSSLPLPERWKYFKENALKDVQPVIDLHSMTAHQFVKMTADDWIEISKKAEKEFDKIIKVFKQIQKEGDYICLQCEFPFDSANGCMIDFAPIANVQEENQVFDEVRSFTDEILFSLGISALIGFKVDNNVIDAYRTEGNY